jgi:hypothetical protein
MPVLSIVKKFNRRSPMNGIIITDKIPFKSKEDGYRFLKALTVVKAEFDLIDYSWALDVDAKNSIEVLENPVNDRTGKLGYREINDT